MAGISVGGVGSGIDIQTLATDLAKAEFSSRFKQLDDKEVGVQAKITGMGLLNSALDELRTSLRPLRLESAYQNKVATIGEPNLLDIELFSTSPEATYTLESKQLATAQNLAFAAQPDSGLTALGTGTLSISLGSVNGGSYSASQTLDITIDGSNNTLSGIADVINAEAEANGFDVRAGVVNTGPNEFRLTLKGENTGSNNVLQVVVADDDGNNTDSSGLSQLAFDPITEDTLLIDGGKVTQRAQDAILSVNGLDITNESNTFNAAIPGATINLKSAAPGTTTNLSVTQDNDSTLDNLEAIVEAYNSFIDAQSELTTFNLETGERGALLGESVVRNTATQLRSLFSSFSSPTDENSISSFSALGLIFNRDGTLGFDREAASSAIEQNPDSVKNFLIGDNDNPDGALDNILSYLDGTLSSSGSFTTRTEALNSQISDIGEQRKLFTSRQTRAEEFYLSRFIVMDRLVAQLQQTGNYLEQQLQNLPGFVRQKN